MITWKSTLATSKSSLQELKYDDFITTFEKELKALAKEGSDWIDDSTLEQLLKTGLTNDVNLLLTEINEMDKLVKNNPKLATSMKLSLIPKINKLINSLNALKEADMSARQKGSFNDIAIDNRGYCFVDVKGKIEAVSLVELYELQNTARANNKPLVTPLTNAELSDARKNNSNYAFNDNIINVINNSVSNKEVMNYVNGIVDKIKNTTEIERKDLPDVERKIAEGVDQLVSSPGNTLRIESLTRNNLELAKLALEFISSNMPDNMLKYLMAQCAMNGEAPTRENMLLLISKLIGSRTQLYNSQKTSDASGSGGSSSSGGSGSDGDSSIKGVASANLAMAMILGKSDTRPYSLQLKGNSVFTINTSNWNHVNHAGSNKPMPTNCNVKYLLGESQLVSIVDGASVTFGGKKMTDQLVSKLMYINDGFRIGAIPYKEVAGHKYPDMDTMKAIDVAKTEYSKNPNISQLELVEILKKNKCNPLTIKEWSSVIMHPEDPSMALKKGLVSRFVMFSAIGNADNNDADLGKIKDYDGLIQLLEGDERLLMGQLYEDTMNDEKAGGTKGSSSFHKHDLLFGYGSRDEIFKGTVYVPLTEEYALAFIDNETYYIPKYRMTANAVEQGLLMIDSISSMNGTSINDLN